jgi:hypothetical protein
MQYFHKPGQYLLLASYRYFANNEKLFQNKKYYCFIRYDAEEREVFTMYDLYLKEAKAIAGNRQINGRTMTFCQLNTLVKLTCKYEYVMPTDKAFTIKQASNEITAVMKAVEKGTIKERSNPYKLDFLMKRLAQKHPHIIEAVANR